MKRWALLIVIVLLAASSVACSEGSGDVAPTTGQPRLTSSRICSTLDQALTDAGDRVCSFSCHATVRLYPASTDSNPSAVKTVLGSVTEFDRPEWVWSISCGALGVIPHAEFYLLEAHGLLLARDGHALQCLGGDGDTLHVP